jgi:pyrimidine-nucleoside phosphorylase
MVPADRKLYALRDVTATVECVPLIAASIISKKAAEGADALVLDVKAGRGGFMKTEADARTLAQTLVSIGTATGMRTQAIITSHDRPLGCAIGNAVEVIECIEVLKGRGPRDLVDLSFALSERMLIAAKVVGTLPEARTKCVMAISSGRALEKFREIIEQQRGDPQVIDDYDRLPQAPHRHRVTAAMSGRLTQVDAELVGRAAVSLGAGRDKSEDAVDPAVGFVFLAAVGDGVERGAPLVDIHYRDPSRLDAALSLLMQAIHISQASMPSKPLIIDEIQ